MEQPEAAPAKVAKTKAAKTEKTAPKTAAPKTAAPKAAAPKAAKAAEAGTPKPSAPKAEPRASKTESPVRKTGTAEVKTAEPRPEAPVEAKTHSAELRATIAALEDLKAEDISIIDLEGKTSIADWMIIATGRSTTQVGALADRAVRALKAIGAPTPKVEGLPACDWVLIDAGDLIVHLFRPEVRAFYNLEKMWGVDRPTEARSSSS